MTELSLSRIKISFALPDDRSMMQTCVVTAGILISASIGYVYADQTMLTGWQLGLWAITALIVIGVLIPANLPKPTLGKWEWLGLALLVLAAALARVLTTRPGNLHVDEVAFADFALRHVYHTPTLTLNPFITGPYCHPSLYFYLVRVSLFLAGQSIEGLRASSALAGVLAIPAVYALVTTFQSRRAAWFAVIVTASYHYHIHWSRVGLNNVWDTVWVPLMLALFMWGWKRRWSGGAALSGACLGLSQYFYPGARIGAFLLAGLIVWLWFREADRRREWAGHIGALLAVTLCIVAPLAIYAVRYPDIFFMRSREIMHWSVDEMGGLSLGAYSLRKGLEAFLAFTTIQDNTVAFYGSGVPLTLGLATPLFLIGLLWANCKRQWLPVAWIGLTAFFGGFLITGWPSNSHYVVVIPAICWLVAMPLDYLAETGRWKLALGALLALVVTDLIFYFVLYMPSPDFSQPFPIGPFS